MNLTSTQRKHLESLANSIESTIRIGKQGMQSKIVESIKDAFNTNELIKIKLLDSSPVTPEAAAETCTKETESLLVRIIGRVIILYRPFSDKPRKIQF